MVSKVPNTFTTSVIQFLLYTQSWSLGFVHRNGSMCLWVCSMCVGLCMMWVSVHSHDYFHPDIIALGLQEVVNGQRNQNSSQNHLTVWWELQCCVMKQFSKKKKHYYLCINCQNDWRLHRTAKQLKTLYYTCHASSWQFHFVKKTTFL